MCIRDRCLADLKGITLEEVAQVTTRNLATLLGLADPNPAGC